MADVGVKVSTNVEVDREGFISQLQALAKGITVKVGVEVDEASKASFLNSLKNIVPKTPVKVRVEPDMAGKNSIAQQISSMAGKISLGKGMQVSKAGMTSMAKQVQSELNRAKLNLKLNKIDADAPITEVGKQLKEEVSDISAWKDVKIDGDTGGLERTLEETAEMSSRVSEGMSEAQRATASWKDQVKDLDRIMKNVSSSTDNALRSKTNSLTNADNVAKVNEEYQKLSDSIRKIRDAGTPVDNSEIVHLEKQVAAYDEMIAKMREAEAMAKSSSAASAQSAAKELAAQQKILDTLEKRANTLYDSALTGKNQMVTDAANVEEAQKLYQDLAESIRQVRQSNSEGSLVDVGDVSEIERKIAALNKFVIAKQKAEADTKSKFESQLTAQMKELDTYMRSVQKTYDSAFSGKTGLITDVESIKEINAEYEKLRNKIEGHRGESVLIDRDEINSIKDAANGLQNLINKKRELENTAPLRQVETFRDQMTRFLQSNPKVLDTSLGSEVKGM